MAFCFECGAKIEDYAKFCSGCGKAVSGVPNEPVASAMQSTTQQPRLERYFISINNNQKGPYYPEQIAQMLVQREITSDWWICQEGSDKWRKIDEIPELKKAAAYSPDLSKRSEKSWGFQSGFAGLCGGVLSIVARSRFDMDGAAWFIGCIVVGFVVGWLIWPTVLRLFKKE